MCLVLGRVEYGLSYSTLAWEVRKPAIACFERSIFSFFIDRNTFRVLPVLGETGELVCVCVFVLQSIRESFL